MARDRVPPRLPLAAILALHVALAAFVTLGGWPVTQDGPAHVYSAHVLRSLAADARSPFRGFFEPNLRPIGNSLFFYAASGAEAILPLERIAGLAMLVALLALPLSAFCFARALRRSADDTMALRIDPAAAAIVACPLAFNYFLYRGFFNFCWSVPLAVATLAAIVAVGRPRQAAARSIALAGAAGALAALAALAHPAALVFLLCAVPAASLAAPRRQRATGVFVVALLGAFAWTSRISSGGSAPVSFSTPWTSVMRAVRVLGVTHGWPELLVALGLLVLLARAGRRALSGLTSRRALTLHWAGEWPAVCAVAMVTAFFFVPFEYGGAAGHNERIPLFAAMLLAPFVKLPARRAVWLLAAFGAFAVYTGYQGVRLERLAAEVREARALGAVPRGSLVYPVVLDLKRGSLAADLGRHVLADVAARRDLVMPDVFCGHPAHPLRCTARLPTRLGEDEVEEFEHAGMAERRAALTNPASRLRRTFAAMRREAARCDYLLVVRADPLRAAFETDVVEPLGATLLGPADRASSPLAVYELPRPPGRRPKS